jgi:hypothetical protein
VLEAVLVSLEVDAMLEGDDDSVMDDELSVELLVLTQLPVQDRLEDEAELLVAEEDVPLE